MISDQDLRDAARAYENAVLETLPEPEDCSAEFSPAFERNMKKLVFRVDHPVLFWLTRLLPVLLLAGAAAAVFLMLNSGAEPEPVPVPSAPPAPSPAVEVVEPPETIVYRPTWLPEGCEPTRETLYGTEGMIVYTTADGTEAVFMYATEGDPSEGAGLDGGKAVQVGDFPALLYLGQSKGSLNDLFWSDGETGASFWISAPFPEEDMIRMAESVEAHKAE